MNGYAHPEVLVETDWVKANLGRPSVKLVEIDVDTTAYDAGHIPGAVGFNWRTQLQDGVVRDVVGKEEFEKLLGGAGISPQDTVILYGDNHNWFAANGFWLFKLYGHEDVRLMNGGRAKWLSEQDKKLTTERPNPKPVPYQVTETHPELRALLPDVLQGAKSGGCNLVDVRSPDEFSGKVIAPP
jgi:thiosulfate/3-mercaptopyruvate sulfurtransferase